MEHLFISYSRQNQTIVQRLKDDLQAAGQSLWIDNVGLQPGTPDRDQALRDAIGSSSAVLLCASPDSRRSPYVRDEIALAKAANKPIYPLWVNGDEWMDSIPMGLGSTQNVDLRGVNYAKNLPRLIGTLAGQIVGQVEAVEPIIDTPQVTETIADPRNPYKGLRAFRAEDVGDFFGREVLITELQEFIANNMQKARFLAVLGASGSGKSSVMMAGLLPKLQTQHPDWVFLDPIVPSANPLEKLTIALARQFENKSHATIREDLLDRSTRGLHRLACEMGDKPVVLYIDQFEEVFTLVDKEHDRRQFIDLLTTAATELDGELIVLLSMRADFYDRPLQYNAFGALVESQHVGITPMTLADLYDVVQKPAQLPDVGLTFEDGLVSEMVFAVREEAAALPLLQFTLDQLFERRDGNTLTMQVYQTMGGIQGALAQHAEATYNNLPSEQHKTLARALFLRLIEAGQTEQDTTRRRANYSELTLTDAELTRILQETAAIFVDARLLVSDNASDTHTLEVSHEALIREWKRLGDWLRDAREDLRLQKSLAADVAEWQRRGKPVDMFYRGTVLADAQAWAARNTASRDETHFLNASQRAEAERIRREERAARNLRYAFGGLIAVILLASVGLALIFARNNADLQEEAENLQAIAATSEYQSNYAQAQVNFAATRDFGISPFDITQTPAADFAATATAYAELSGWEPVTQDFDGVEMVLVPAGCFYMGSNVNSSEQPIHEICFDEPFWIDKYEVSNEQYGSTGCTDYSSDPDQPRNCVNWFDPRAFCQARGADLPTEAEWEYAARGVDSLVYPWGNDYDAALVIGSDDPTYGNTNTAPVGSRPAGASWVGALDMSGNLWEWTLSAYQEYPYDADDGRNDDLNSTSVYRVLRGGSFIDDTSNLRAAYRININPEFEFVNIGFRCARSY